MAKYAYEDLSEKQFEQLVVFVCQRLLGMSVKGFAPGPDGGRDAFFSGTAELHPSKASPWIGKVVIQAKHTSGYNKSFSEADFFSVKSSANILGKEIPRIRTLRAARDLDFYMLFANRTLTALADTAIAKHLIKNCALPEGSVYLCGTQQLEVWLKQFPEIAGLADLDPYDSPLIVSPEDLAEVIEALASRKQALKAMMDDAPEKRTDYEKKNAANNMSADFARGFRSKYLKDTPHIKSFLSDPDNYRYLRQYEAVVDEFQISVIAKRKDFQSFDQMIVHLYRLLIGRDPILARNKRLTMTMLFYMYWNCDLGVTEDAGVN